MNNLVGSSVALRTFTVLVSIASIYLGAKYFQSLHTEPLTHEAFSSHPALLPVPGKHQMHSVSRDLPTWGI